MCGFYLSVKQMALNSRFILGGALFAAAMWWTREKPPVQEACETAVTCSSCEERLYDIYRYNDSSFCRQCHEELEQQTSDEEEI